MLVNSMATITCQVLDSLCDHHRPEVYIRGPIVLHDLDGARLDQSPERPRLTFPLLLFPNISPT